MFPPPRACVPRFSRQPTKYFLFRHLGNEILFEKPRFVTLINFRLLDRIKRPYEDLVDACFSGADQSWPIETFYFEEELESFRQLLINDTGYFTFLSRNIWENDSIFSPRALVISERRSRVLAQRPRT